MKVQAASTEINLFKLSIKDVKRVYKKLALYLPYLFIAKVCEFSASITQNS